MGIREEAHLALQHLELARTHLRAYQDLIWDGIDRRDSISRAQGVAIYDDIDARLAKLDALVSEIRQVIENSDRHPQSSSHQIMDGTDRESHLPQPRRFESTQQPANRRRMSRARDTIPLDCSVSYSLDTDFTATTPWGFDFQGHVETGISDWTSLYTRICQVIEGRYPGKLHEYRIETGRVLVGRDRSRMDTPKHVANGLYVETKLDNNYKVRNLKHFLEELGLSPAALRIFLARGPAHISAKPDARSRQSGPSWHLISGPRTH